MGIIAIDKIDNLLWLGRYSERVYTTIREFFEGYDKMLDQHDFYLLYCQQLQIPNIYKDQRDFVERYVKDEQDMNSIISNLIRAYDNCIVSRNELGTETLSYLELALNDIKRIDDFDSFILDLQTVIDHLLAFFASLDDFVEDRNVKSIVKLGKRIERLDLYLRLHKNDEYIQRAFRFLETRINKNSIPFDKEQFMKLKEMIESHEYDYEDAITIVESLV